MSIYPVTSAPPDPKDTPPRPRRSREPRAALGALLLLAGLVAGPTFVGSPEATAAAAPTADTGRGAVTVNCSWRSCSTYFSRSATRELNARVGSWTASAEKTATGICAVAFAGGGLPGVVCSGSALVAAGNLELAKEQIKEAAETHGPRGACFKMTKPHVANVFYYSTDNGRFCKN